MVLKRRSDGGEQCGGLGRRERGVMARNGTKEGAGKQTCRLQHPSTEGKKQAIERKERMFLRKEEAKRQRRENDRRKEERN